MMETLIIQVTCDVDEDMRDAISYSIQTLLGHSVPYMADNVDIQEVES